jgi:hypothetical protein
VDVADYQEWYKSEFGHYPGAKCIEAFKKLHPPDPTPEEFFAEPDPKLPKFRVRRDEIEKDSNTICK